MQECSPHPQSSEKYRPLACLPHLNALLIASVLLIAAIFSVQIAFYFGYMAVVCYAFLLMLGTVGFRASLTFVRYRANCCPRAKHLNACKHRSPSVHNVPETPFPAAFIIHVWWRPVSLRVGLHGQINGVTNIVARTMATSVLVLYVLLVTFWHSL